jgi:hypothetical protein
MMNNIVKRQRYASQQQQHVKNKGGLASLLEVKSPSSRRPTRNTTRCDHCAILRVLGERKIFGLERNLRVHLHLHLIHQPLIKSFSAFIQKKGPSTKVVVI